MKIVIASLLILGSFACTAQVKVGESAPEISLPDTKDNTVTLSSFKGKVVLIDFWASWCGPCRRSNPNVVRLYNKYKSKGFEVLGVSIDNKKTAWIKAIQQDKLPYVQVNDIGGWDTGVAFKYGVDAIPATFLLNKNGVIEAVNLEGKELKKKIIALLK